MHPVLALDRERETIYLFLPSKKHTEGQNQSPELVGPVSGGGDMEPQLISLTHAHAHFYMQTSKQLDPLSGKNVLSEKSK